MRSMAWRTLLITGVLAAAALPASGQQAPDPAPLQPGLAAPLAADAQRDNEWQQPRRQTRRFARAGAVLGAIGGAGFGGLWALICLAESDSCYWTIPAGAVLGAGAGAVAGAIVGAAVPTDSLPRDTEGRPVAPLTRRIGSVAVAAGAAQMRREDWDGSWIERGGIATRVNLAAELRPWFALGPEAGLAFFGDGEQVRHIAVEARLSRPGARFTPHVSGNLGLYHVAAPSLEFLGGSLAAGVRWAPARDSRRFLDAGARLSRNAQNIEPMRMSGVYLGGGVYW